MFMQLYTYLSPLVNTEMEQQIRLRIILYDVGISSGKVVEGKRMPVSDSEHGLCPEYSRNCVS